LHMRRGRSYLYAWETVERSMKDRNGHARQILRPRRMEEVHASAYLGTWAGGSGCSAERVISRATSRCLSGPQNIALISIRAYAP
jgi:hypothetical protein